MAWWHRRELLSQQPDVQALEMRGLVLLSFTRPAGARFGIAISGRTQMARLLLSMGLYLRMCALVTTGPEMCTTLRIGASEFEAPSRRHGLHAQGRTRTPAASQAQADSTRLRP